MPRPPIHYRLRKAHSNVQQIAVIDYGMGNLRSVSKAIEAVAEDASVIVTSDPDVIEQADRVVCPGQGAARECMAALNHAGLSSVIRQCVSEKPFLGICMGLQVLLSHSDENDGTPCLDIIEGQVQRLPNPLTDADGNRLKVPHMGWSRVAQVTHPLWSGIPDGARFYFAHSFFIVPSQQDIITARCTYGAEFAVAISAHNLFACQFHPEKSAEHGLRLLSNFVHWNGVPA